MSYAVEHKTARWNNLVGVNLQCGCELERRNSRDKMRSAIRWRAVGFENEPLISQGVECANRHPIWSREQRLVERRTWWPGAQRAAFQPTGWGFLHTRARDLWLICSLSAKRASFMILVSVSSALKGGNWRGVRVEPWKGRETLWGKAA